MATITGKAASLTQAAQLSAEQGRPFSVWQEDRYFYVRSSGANDAQARRKGWKLVAVFGGAA